MKPRTVSRRLGRMLLLAAGGMLLMPSLVIIAYSVMRPPVTPLMLIRAAEAHGFNYRWVPLAEISPNLMRAAIAAEDNRFCHHFGFDVEAIADEIDDWIDGGRPRGGSTITQQVAKNILLWPGRDWLRKGIETWMTPQIELLWSKRRILEVYLNVIEMGPGVYGAEAAARRFFGKPASQLSLHQASLIAAVLPAPLIRSASQPSQAVSRRAVRIGSRAQRLGPLISCIRTE